ncbi:hypothetical protein BaRGS_00024214 [Batillaria attramentaria]|uniref:C1q domain-containing protein n=1 Tax=Batillaria attramentaria TaxID=370345 RepID=A0ABD0KC97_9CAEN
MLVLLLFANWDSSLAQNIHPCPYFPAKRAAFHATLGKDPTPNSPIHFNLPEQLGAGFDTATGIYTAPYSGWYTFEFQLFPRATALVNVDLIRNGGLVARARCDDEPDYSTCSSGITLHVNEGDKIWLQTNFGGPYNMAYFDNIFSGVLVIPDP